jgi:hypothetical protein
VVDVAQGIRVAPSDPDWMLERRAHTVPPLITGSSDHTGRRRWRGPVV